MAKYPKISGNTTSNKYDLGTYNSNDGIFGVYTFTNNDNTQQAFAVVVVRNTDTSNSLHVNDISLDSDQNSNIGNAFLLDPLNNLSELHLGAEVNQLLAPGSEGTSTSDIEDGGVVLASKVLTIPDSGSVDENSELNVNTNYKIIPIYTTTDISSNPISPNSYAAFIIRYKPSNVINEGVVALSIDTSSEVVSINLECSSYDELNFIMQKGFMTGLTFNTDSNIQDNGILDLGLFPIGTSSVNSNNAMHFRDVSTNQGTYYITSSNINDEDDFDSVAGDYYIKDFTSQIVDNGSGITSITNSVAFPHNFENNASLFTLVKRYQLKVDATIHQTASFSNTNQSIVENYSASDFVMYLSHKINVQDAASNVTTYKYFAKLGFYPQTTIPSSQAGDIIHNHVLDNNDNPEYYNTANLPLYNGGATNLRVNFRHNNFNGGGEYEVDSFVMDEHMILQGSKAFNSKPLKYIEVFTENDTSPLSNVNNGTDANTTVNTFLASAMNGDTKDIAVRYPITIDAAFVDLYSTVTQDGVTTYHAINEDSVDGHIEATMTTPLSSTAGLFKGLESQLSYKIGFHPKPCELIISKQGTSTGTYHSNDVAVTNWYLEGTSTVVPNTSPVNSDYSGYSGASISNLFNTTSDVITYNPDFTLVNVNGGYGKEFIPLNKIFQKNTYYDSSANKHIARLGFGFSNEGDNNMYIKDVSVAVSRITDADGVPNAPAGQVAGTDYSWAIISNVNASSYPSTTSVSYYNGGTNGYQNHHDYFSEDALVISRLHPDYQPGYSMQGEFSHINMIYFEATPGANADGDYYAEVSVKYFKDDFVSRGSGDSAFHFTNDAAGRETKFIVKVALNSEGDLSIFDLEGDEVSSSIAFGNLNIG